jgi:phenylacetate-coenzyme A ligase PaaK-like adenylate-forming protein
MYHHRVQRYSKRDACRARWTAETVRHAARLDFYRWLWGSNLIERASRGAVPLESLPTFDKATYVEHLEQFIPEGDEASLWVSHTSGSTGEPVPRYRTAEEVSYLERFLSRLANRAPSLGAILTTDEWDRAHGRSARIRVAGPVHTLDHSALGSPDALLDAITQPIGSPPHAARAGTLAMGLEPIIRATYAMDAAGWPPHEVRTVVTVGGLVTPWQRTQLERLWGAVLVDRFSASEAIGGASLCRSCWQYHPDPYVHYGCVSVRDAQRPVSHGSGLLAVTELWPLTRARPLIRYITGDLIEVATGRCPRDPFAFRWLGRYAPAAQPSALDGRWVEDRISA